MSDWKRFENKLDVVVEKIGEINVTLAKQSVVLDEHIRRTEAIEEKLVPLDKHMYMINGGLKIIGGLAVLVGIIEGIIHLVGK